MTDKATTNNESKLPMVSSRMPTKANLNAQSEIVLEKHFKHKVPAINDFDAVFSNVTKNNVSHIKYYQYEYMVNTREPIKVSEKIHFQLLNIEYKADNISFISIRLYTDNGNIDDIHEYIKQSRKDYEADKNNKLGRDIYYFDHETNIKDAHSDSYVVFSKKHYHTDKTFKNVFFRDKDVLEKRVVHFLNNRQWYKDRGIPYTLGFMFHGGPGTGKTSTIKAIANVSKRHVFNIRLSDISTNTQLKNLFQNEYVQILDPINGTMNKFIVPVSKRLYVIEDIDCMTDLVKRRDLLNEGDSVNTRGGTNPADKIKDIKTKLRSLSMNGGDSYIEQIELEEELEALKDKLNGNITSDAITLDSLLNILDGTFEIPNRMFCITTNDPDIIDPALIRPGRVDMIVEFTNASRNMICDMFVNFYGTEFSIAKFQKIKEAKVSPAKIHQILFKHFDHPDGAILEIEVLSNKRLPRKAGFKRKLQPQIQASSPMVEHNKKNITE